MLRSIDKQSGESVDSVLKKTRMLFLTPNQQCQSTEGKLASKTYFIIARLQLRLTTLATAVMCVSLMPSHTA